MAIQIYYVPNVSIDKVWLSGVGKLISEELRGKKIWLSG